MEKLRDPALKDIAIKLCICGHKFTNFLTLAAVRTTGLSTKARMFSFLQIYSSLRRFLS